MRTVPLPVQPALALALALAGCTDPGTPDDDGSPVGSVVDDDSTPVEHTFLSERIGVLALYWTPATALHGELSLAHAVLSRDSGSSGLPDPLAWLGIDFPADSWGSPPADGDFYDSSDLDGSWDFGSDVYYDAGTVFQVGATLLDADESYGYYGLDRFYATASADPFVPGTALDLDVPGGADIRENHLAGVLFLPEAPAFTSVSPDEVVTQVRGHDLEVTWTAEPGSRIRVVTWGSEDVAVWEGDDPGGIVVPAAVAEESGHDGYTLVVERVAEADVDLGEGLLTARATAMQTIEVEIVDLLQADPWAFDPGSTVEVALVLAAGEFAGPLSVGFGEGVSLIGGALTGPSTADVEIAVDADAAPGFRDVTFETAAGPAVAPAAVVVRGGLPVYDTCDEAVAGVSVGPGLYFGDFGDFVDDHSGSSRCTGWLSMGPDAFVPVHIEAGQSLYVRMQGDETVDSALYVVPACDAEELACSDVTFEGEAESVRARVEEAGTVLVIADTWVTYGTGGEGVGPFELELRIE